LKDRIIILLKPSISLSSHGFQNIPTFGWLDIGKFKVNFSLGGALASLVALTNELPCIAFESPGDLQYASRLGLLPKTTPEELDRYLSNMEIYHFGNTGDPVYLGQCTGVTSSCYWLDYALESKCHIGKECIYDHTKVLRDETSMASIQYHSIEYVINNIIKPSPLPICTYQPSCLATECQTWTFVD
jgi:lipase ATG15